LFREAHEAAMTPIHITIKGKNIRVLITLYLYLSLFHYYFIIPRMRIKFKDISGSVDSLAQP
jgi:hypothetical protein